MAKAGRKSKYDDYVEPFLAEITKWAESMTERQIAERLGVGYRNFCDYKSKYPQLEQAIKSGRQSLVVDLKSTLIKKAKGYTYAEKKVITQQIMFKNGNEELPAELVRTEVTTKYSHPDTGAIHLLLKNYDCENWCNDPQIMELKKQELELKKQQAEKDNW